MNFKMGLSIREIGDHSLLVVKRNPSLPDTMQLNAFSCPPSEVTDVSVVVVVVLTVDGNCDPRSNLSRFFSRDEDDSVLFDSNGDAVALIPPGAAHKLTCKYSKATNTKMKVFRTILQQPHSCNRRRQVVAVGVGVN